MIFSKRFLINLLSSVRTTKSRSFELPALLSSLVESGAWPTESPFEQEFAPIFGQEAARKLSPDDDRIILMTPPFYTIGDEIRSGNRFWKNDVSNPNEIDYDKALIIADFGLGSDSPIILYYETAVSPTVMYLRWIGSGKNIRHQWIETHSSFDDFATEVGLEQLKKRG